MVKVEDGRPCSLEAEPQRPERDPSSQEWPGREKLLPEETKADDAEAGAEDSDSRPRGSFLRRHRLVLIFAAIALVAGAIAAHRWWTVSSEYVTTDDAFIAARFFTVSPKVGGYIIDVPVTDNERVSANQVLTKIDPRDYEAALDQAQAQLAQAEAAIPNIDAQIQAQKAQIAQAEAQVNDAKAALKFAQEENDRAQRLVKTGAGTVQAAQQTQSQLLQAQATTDGYEAALLAAQRQLTALQAQRRVCEAAIAAAKAQVEQAALNLSYTVVKADQAGNVVQLTAAKGQLVQPGQSLMVIVPAKKWVVANFRETELYRIHPGQRVKITVDAYPGRVFKGQVTSIQRGSGTAFSLLPAENATGNFVKVVQRVPVRIDFDKEPNVVLGPGMSVEPSVYVG
ncbi:MAG: HlyD family secretion protein [Rhodomicrobium sp.]